MLLWRRTYSTRAAEESTMRAAPDNERLNRARRNPWRSLMLKWLLAIVILAVVSGLGSSLSPRRWRFGHLPGDLHFDIFGRHIHIPLTSTLLLSLLVGLLIRWL